MPFAGFAGAASYEANSPNLAGKSTAPTGNIGYGYTTPANVQGRPLYRGA
jgi:hypothetical protein